MTRFFRSKSCTIIGLTDSTTTPPAPAFHSDDDDEEDEDDDVLKNPIATTPFITPGTRRNNNQLAILDAVAGALRKSLVTCSVVVEREEDDDDDVAVCGRMDISSPSDVKHVSHVIFDRFDGFLGLPSELLPQVPSKVPSASANVFGVSAKSMQCSYDDRGNCVPTILLMMQNHLYVGGGLKAEGIFRINAENSHEEYVRHELNNGVVPRGIDVHCLAGLIKAWFRELPCGVLDSLTAEQVMHCNTEDDCTQLIKLLPPTEAALLDWAINLMADVAEHEHYNKMNARNIAMVFAPNMTQMADPLTALIHAVQVMNLLKTLILKNLCEREESASKARLQSPCSYSPNDKSERCRSNSSEPHERSRNSCAAAVATTTGKFLSSVTVNTPESNNLDKHQNIQKTRDGEQEFEHIRSCSPPPCKTGASENGCKDGYENGDWLRLREGVRRLCRHAVFQLSKPAKKTRGLSIVNTNGGGEAWE